MKHTISYYMEDTCPECGSDEEVQDLILNKKHQAIKVVGHRCPDCGLKKDFLHATFNKEKRELIIGEETFQLDQGDVDSADYWNSITRDDVIYDFNLSNEDNGIYWHLAQYHLRKTDNPKYMEVDNSKPFIEIPLTLIFS